MHISCTFHIELRTCIECIVDSHLVQLSWRWQYFILRWHVILSCGKLPVCASRFTNAMEDWQAQDSNHKSNLQVSKVLRVLHFVNPSISKQSLDSFLCTLNLAKWLSCHAYHDSVKVHPFSWGPRRLTLSRKHEPRTWKKHEMSQRPLVHSGNAANALLPRSYAVASIFCCLVLGTVCIMIFYWHFQSGWGQSRLWNCNDHCNYSVEPCYLCRVPFPIRLQRSVGQFWFLHT